MTIFNPWTLYPDQWTCGWPHSCHPKAPSSSTSQVGNLSCFLTLRITRDKPNRHLYMTMDWEGCSRFIVVNTFPFGSVRWFYKFMLGEMVQVLIIRHICATVVFDIMYLSKSTLKSKFLPRSSAPIRYFGAYYNAIWHMRKLPLNFEHNEHEFASWVHWLTRR